MAAHHTLRKILCIWLTVGSLCAYAFNPPTGWQITELYDGNGTYAGQPVVSEPNYVAWIGVTNTAYGPAQQVFLYDGASTQALTNDEPNNSYDWHKQDLVISGSNVAWTCKSDYDYEIFFYNGSTVSQITQNNRSEYDLSLSGSNLAWRELSDLSQVFLYNGSTVSQISNSAVRPFFPVLVPDVCGSRVVWTQRLDNTSGPIEVFLYDGTSPTRVTNNSIEEIAPVVSDSYMAWVERTHDYCGNVMFHTGTSTIQLSDPNTTNDQLDIASSRVVWRGQDPNTVEQIYLYNGTSVIQVTQSVYTCRFPQVSDALVVWECTNSSMNTAVFAYDGLAIAQLCDYSYGEKRARLDGNTVVWQEWDAGVGSSGIIYMARPAAQ